MAGLLSEWHSQLHWPTHRGLYKTDSNASLFLFYLLYRIYLNYLITSCTQQIFKDGCNCNRYRKSGTCWSNLLIILQWKVNSGSQLLLDNAEKYALYLANAQTNNKLEVFGRLNIGEFKILNMFSVWDRFISPDVSCAALGINRINYTDGKDYSFPQSAADLANFSTSQTLPAQITIPSTIISERTQGQGLYL